VLRHVLVILPKRLRPAGTQVCQDHQIYPSIPWDKRQCIQTGSQKRTLELVAVCPVLVGISLTFHLITYASSFPRRILGSQEATLQQGKLIYRRKSPWFVGISVESYPGKLCFPHC